MATKGNSGENRTRGSMSLFIVVGLCCFFYILGAWQRSGFGKGDSIALEITKKTDCSILSNLNYETHHGGDAGTVDDSESNFQEFKPCDDRYIDYTPCQDQMRAMLFPRKNMNYRERHCPPPDEKLHCLIPAPKGYATPFRWPKSRDYVPYANAPYKSLTVEKAVQNWIQYEGNVFRFPGGGTQFPHGADAYIEELASVIPMDSGMVRTALDTGCGVASWGAYLFKKNVITMSFAPRDSHEAQVQFALERGVPAVIGVLGTIKLPYSSRAFDMAHCSRCLIPWSANELKISALKDLKFSTITWILGIQVYVNRYIMEIFSADGMYMMEIDRVLRPGGYWVLSGPLINWRTNYQAWQRPIKELEEEQRKIEEIAKLLCWEKKHEKGETAIWQKRINYDYCQEQDTQPTMCESTDAEDVWYKKMEACVTPYPETTGPDKVVGGTWKSFPERLNAVPFRISSGSIKGIGVEAYQEDNRSWRKHVNSYKRINKILDSGRYRNIMDMNAGLGSFAAAIESPKLWVMNVMPTIAEKDTLGVIYERGLIGIYHDWCEAFSTYPRTYDLIHANGVFTLYKDKCNAEDILLEMDRILRPEGAVIIRDQADVLVKVRKIVGGMRWNTKIIDHEDGPLVTEKILFAVKRYWVTENVTSSP
ncbi:putative methyltransferase PMT2 [Citrus sinensis]|uniref:Methyltransferase PMT2 n=2 Tax=Citrus sinensis TaxID=2711 RepID=A0ACB8LQW3_CITSI|nr:putative methyltransferase PMT2 [Citrus sinensis]